MGDFKKQQQAFASYIKDPLKNPAPVNIEDRRLAIYRDLFFNNVEGFLSNSFPVLKSITSDENWLEMARDFFSSHACHTPLFSEIAEEFIEYLQNERQHQSYDPPFLLELAHYEWIEMAVAISDEDKNLPAADPNGGLLEKHPQLSPVMRNLSYHFPVHQIGPDFQPQQVPAEMTHLVVYRNRQDEVLFLEINAVTQRLLEILKQNPQLTGLDAVTRIAEELQHPDPLVILEAGKNLLYDLRSKDVIIGTAA